MQFLAALATIVAVATAIPQQSSGGLIPREKLAEMTVGQAQDSCGNNQQLNCCNDSSAKQSENHSQGLLSGVLNGLLGNDGLRLTGQCSPIDITVIGANSLLNGRCTGRVACCQKSGNGVQNGLINVALPCVALGSLIG